MVLSQIPPNLTNNFPNLYCIVILYEFRHLHIPQKSRDDDISGPKYLVSGIKNICFCDGKVKLFLCLTN
jgi:hypothetical protein